MTEPQRFNLVDGALELAAASILGGRVDNQDSWLVDESTGLVVVADGVGGLPAGATASELVCDTMKRAIAKDRFLDQSVTDANLALIDQAQHLGLSQIGSTVVALRWQGPEFRLIWVGDSAAFGVFDGSVRPLTVPHTLAQAQVSAGTITPHMARDFPQGNVITQALGVTPPADLKPGLGAGTLLRDERIVLTTDGLLDVLSETEIAQILCRETSVSAGLEQLMAEASARRPRDNVTVVVGRWRG